MKSLDEMLKPVRDALVSVSDNVGHHRANDATRTYVVYSEEEETGALSADNEKLLQTIGGSIDLYALPEDYKLFDKIQEALGKEGVSFLLESVQREEANMSRFIHYEWTFEVT